MYGEVMVITRMLKLPKCCTLCSFYNRKRGKNKGTCMALGGNWSTEDICASKERLPNCPLIRICGVTRDQIMGRGMDRETE